MTNEIKTSGDVRANEDDNASDRSQLVVLATSSQKENATLQRSLTTALNHHRLELLDTTYYAFCLALVYASLTTRGGQNEAQGFAWETATGIGWNFETLIVASLKLPDLLSDARKSILHSAAKNAIAFLFAATNFLVLPALTIWGYWTSVQDFQRVKNSAGNIIASQHSFGNHNALRWQSVSFAFALLSFSLPHFYSAYRGYKKRTRELLEVDRHQKTQQFSYATTETTEQKIRHTAQYNLLKPDHKPATTPIMRPDHIPSTYVAVPGTPVANNASVAPAFEGAENQKALMLAWLLEKQHYLLWNNLITAAGYLLGAVGAFCGGESNDAASESQSKNYLISAAVFYTLAVLIKIMQLVRLVVADSTPLDQQVICKHFGIPAEEWTTHFSSHDEKLLPRILPRLQGLMAQPERAEPQPSCVGQFFKMVRSWCAEEEPLPMTTGPE